jgi:hypothetical protein
MNGLLGNLRRSMPPPESISSARGVMDSLPAIVDALRGVPQMIRDLPPAPIIAGAASRMVADALSKELLRRGPSAGFLAATAAAGLDDAVALQLHEQLVMELGR